MPYGKGTYGNQVGRPKKVRPTGGPGKRNLKKKTKKKINRRRTY